MYNLYFIIDGKLKFYGCGNIRYINELLYDYIRIHDMYDKDEVSFKITKNKLKE